MTSTSSSKFFSQKDHSRLVAYGLTLWVLVVAVPFCTAEGAGSSTASQLTTALLASYLPSRQEYVGTLFNESIQELNQLQPQDYSIGPPPGWEFISPTQGWRKVASALVDGNDVAFSGASPNPGGKRLLNTLGSNGDSAKSSGQSSSDQGSGMYLASETELSVTASTSGSVGEDAGSVRTQDSLTGSGGQVRPPSSDSSLLFFPNGTLLKRPLPRPRSPPPPKPRSPPPHPPSPPPPSPPSLPPPSPPPSPPSPPPPSPPPSPPPPSPPSPPPPLPPPSPPPPRPPSPPPPRPPPSPPPPRPPSPPPPRPPSPPPSPPPKTTVPQPSGGLPEISQIYGCPDARNVKRFGAKGDGVTDESAALARANSQLDFLYFPPGSYRLTRALTLTKPIVVGLGAYFWIDPNVNFVITQQPHHWAQNSPMFNGPGRVRLWGNRMEVHPDWFRAYGRDDAGALQAASDACAGSCIIMLQREYKMNKPWFLSPTAGTFGTNRGIMWYTPQNTQQGIVLRPGKYELPLIITNVQQFQQYCIKVQGGVTKAELQIGAMGGCGDALVFAPAEGDASGVIQNVHVTHASAIHTSQNAVVVWATAESQQLQDVTVRANFILRGGINQPWAQSASLYFKGVAPRLTRTAVIFQAVDATQWDNTQHVLLQSQARGAISGLRLEGATWIGAFFPPGRLVDGEFNNLDALITTATDIDPNYFLWLRGQNNKVSVGTVGSPFAKPVSLPLVSNSLRSFNSGAAATSQVTYVAAPAYGDWQPGEVRTFYFYSTFAPATANNRWCVPFRSWNPSIVCAGVENKWNQNNQFEVAVKLKNAAAWTVPADWAFQYRFAVQT